MSSRCDKCVERSVFHLCGTAAHRGYLWAARVIRSGRRDRSLPWWPYEDPRVRELAVACVADIAGEDPRLLERLAREAYDSAALTWVKGLQLPYYGGAGG